MEQKDKFYQLLEDHIMTLEDNKKEAFCTSQSKYNHILQALQLAKGAKCAQGAKFKHRAGQHFCLQTIGTRTLVYCVKAKTPLVTKEDTFETIKKCHEEVCHSGRDKTWHEVKTNYSGIKYDAIDVFLKTCTSCSTRKVHQNAPSGKPMINLTFLLRLQVDLIDYRNRPDGDFKWVLHARDHFTKFSWAYALKSKCAQEVADAMINQFSVFGAPKIMQTDNGREFTARVINELTTMWPGMVIIHGRPRHPQSQGCVERGNGDLEIKLGKWMDEHGSEWTKGLKFVVHAINTSISDTTGKSPYQLVFGQPPRTNSSLWQELSRQGILYEENLPEDFLQQLEMEESVPHTSDSSQHTPRRLEESVPHTSDSSQHTPRRLEKSVPHTSDSSQHTPRRLEESVSNHSHGKRGREYILLHDHRMIATGTECPSRNMIHGQSVNTSSHAVVSVTEVHDAEFIPVEDNPFEECIEIGQFVTWRRSQMFDVDEGDSHREERMQARKKYLKAAKKQESRYVKKVASRTKVYSLGDTVGLNIHKVDRANSDARLLPCKVLMSKPVGGQRHLYKLYSATGILGPWIAGEELSDLRSVHFESLNEVNPDLLEEISLIKACRLSVKWRDTGSRVPSGASVCKCKGPCTTKRCCCRKAGLECGTKCHTDSKACKNTE
ncbi:KRAB-A domain-containing protein 2-like [Littorina saxatilis]|uniref:Integrase catalytic domain-containing protein n=1 Tax=Littorina saxatilis TaxID=31220 RepID=A0AAN9G7V0_9CAEN